MANIGFTGDDLRRRLQAYDRSPFLDLLAIMLENAPSEGDILKMASKYPDKYIAAVSQLARTAGFTDKTETTHNVNLNVGQMSDSQLEDQLRQMSQKLDIPMLEVIDVVAVEVDDG